MENVLDSDSFNDFLDAYRECALWCGVIVENEETGELENDSGNTYTVSDLSVTAVQESQLDCASFFEQNLELLKETGEHDFAKHGRDFWFSRCGHGAGFWDRSYGALGDVLHRNTKPYGSTDLIVGDDGFLIFT